MVPVESNALRDQCCETPLLPFSVSEDQTPPATLPSEVSMVSGPFPSELATTDRASSTRIGVEASAEALEVADAVSLGTMTIAKLVTSMAATTIKFRDPSFKIPSAFGVDLSGLTRRLSFVNTPQAICDTESARSSADHLKSRDNVRKRVPTALGHSIQSEYTPG